MNLRNELQLKNIINIKLMRSTQLHNQLEVLASTHII